MSLADVQITLAPNALVAHVTGEVDMSNAEEMGATVIGATPNEARGVVLDLSAVEYLDSAGIYVIYGIRSSLQARGQALILVIPPRSPVHDALRLAGAEHPGEVTEQVEEALRVIEDAGRTD
ncbi:MAG: STAS domain-containing protein [Solirubrobacterales bacterium]|nr:STAS domain-containing protein [Solirubrobacterales bacterium]MBV9366624.1 STAS domain-containing protein [Solirubrobacterales bacterium]MBV9806846.1 STAS domain-containing protein [Solirubrobacterales bacterium]